MDSVLDRLTFAPIHDQALRLVMQGALTQFYAFTLVLVRLSGLMIVGPIFGQRLVPGNVRVLLILTLAFLITPAVSDHSRLLFDKLDSNHDGRLTADEVPESLRGRYEMSRHAAGKDEADGLTQSEFQSVLHPPRTILDYARVAICELALGFSLGLGVFTILTGLLLAGDLIDQQTGLALGQIADPSLNITGSVTGQFLFQFAMTVLLVMQPTGYHLTMLSALVSTFQSLPLGEAFVSVPVIDLLRDLVHQSLILGVQVAAPLLASMSLVALTMGFLGHSVPQINIMIVGFPIRAAVSLLVLAASVTGIARSVIDLVPATIDALVRAIGAG
ncbi:MAG TPA: flagellar biosynthetic protein FliR [Planctomycetaceae bacterium]|jgi:flagellar biosynthetic protein FliR|nr:flagellar biosynthetic protein FliR [Planctomycetaceae bacterium]